MNEPIPTHTVEESMIWRNGRNNGIREERERIIKVLETAPKDNYFVWGVIALIKGENK